MKNKYLVIGPIVQNSTNYVHYITNDNRLMVIPPRTKEMYNFNLIPLDYDDLYFRSIHTRKVYSCGNTPATPISVALSETGEYVLIYHYSYSEASLIDAPIDTFLEGYCKKLISERNNELGCYKVYKCLVDTYNTFLRISNTYRDLDLLSFMDEEELNSITTKGLFSQNLRTHELTGLEDLARMERSGLMVASSAIIKYNGQLIGVRRISNDGDLHFFDLKARMLELCKVKSISSFLNIKGNN